MSRKLVLKYKINQIVGGYRLLDYTGVSSTSHQIWIIECQQCFNVLKTKINHLKNKSTKYCKKCNKPHLSHGKTHKDVFRSWQCMWQRVKRQVNKNNPTYDNIYVDARWKIFTNFLEDMGEPLENHTLDRIDNTKGYYKENCRWATPSRQARNRKTSRNFTFDGITKNLQDWSEETGIDARLVDLRYRRGLKKGLNITKEYLFGPKRTNQYK